MTAQRLVMFPQVVGPDIVINTIDDGVLAISREGNIELINPSAQRIIGWNQGDALGLKWQSVIQLVTADGKDVTVTENPVMQSLINNRPAHSDKLLLRTASDKQILISIVASPVGKDNEGIMRCHFGSGKRGRAHWAGLLPDAGGWVIFLTTLCKELWHISIFSSITCCVIHTQ